MLTSDGRWSRPDNECSTLSAARPCHRAVARFHTVRIHFSRFDLTLGLSGRIDAADRPTANQLARSTQGLVALTRVRLAIGRR